MAKRLCAPNAGVPSQIPGQGTRSHMPQLRTAHATNETQRSQINKYKYFLFLFFCCCWQSNVSAFFFFFFPLQYCIGFAIHWHESTMGVHVIPILNPHPLPSPSHPSGSSQCTSPEHPASCIEPGLAIHFTYDNLHVLMPFSHIILPLPSPTESKSLFCTSVSLLLSHIQGYRYHLSKFHIYALVYCIGVFLSGLLHSV